MSQIITVTFAEGQREAIAAQPLEQWAYGQTLQFEGLDLPQAYRVDFSNFEYCGASIPRVGGPDGVAVPVEVLTSGRNVYAFIWVQDETSGARYRRATVRVVPGPEPDTDESPEEQSAVTEAINALNAAVEAIPAEIQAAMEEAKQSGEYDGNRIWYSTIVPDKISSTISQLTFSQLLGVPDATPQIGDLVVAPEPKYYPTPQPITGTPTYLLVISDTPVGYQLARLTSVGSLRGAQGIQGEQGPRGLQGEPGLGFPAGGTSLYVLRKKTDADYDTEWANPMDLMSDDVKQALLQLARKVAYIDDQGQTYYDDLYDAFYPPKTVVLITAVFEQGSTVIYDDTALDDLKQYLTVTAKYDDNTTAILPDGAYTLSGLLEEGTSTVTVSYNSVTTTFTVNVTARPTLSSISAVYTQSGTVYDTDTLDSLKDDLVVTAHYSDSSTQTVSAANYTLSGTLTAGTSTITIAYGGKTTTFSVTVEYGMPSGYTPYDYIQLKKTASFQTARAGQLRLKKYDNLNVLSCEFAYCALSGHTDGTCIWGRRAENGSVKSYAFYSNTGYLGFHIHGQDGYPSRIAAAEDSTHVVRYANAQESPSTLSVDNGASISIPWANNDVLNLDPTLLTNPTNDTTNFYVNPKIQVGYIKFFDLSGNLVGHYIPAVRTSDNVLGMYDVVEKNFYTTPTASYSTIDNSNCKYLVGNW